METATWKRPLCFPASRGPGRLLALFFIESKGLANVRPLSLYRSRLNHNQFDIRSLNTIKYKGKLDFAHTLNATFRNEIRLSVRRCDES